MNIDIQEIISQIIAFLIMIWLLKRYAFGPIWNMMQERQRKIENEFAAIEKQRASAESLLEHYKEKIQDIDAEGRRKLQLEISKGREIALEIQREANRKSEVLMQKAEENIVHEIAQAKVQLKKDIVDMVIATTEKVLESRLDDAEKHNIVIEHFADKAKLK